MYVAERLIYLQLQKTACTHIASRLARHLPGELRGKHGPLTLDTERLIVGSIRNPWDWYVSLWAYGCLNKGAVHAALTASVPTATYRRLRGALLHPGQYHQLATGMSLLLAKDATHLRSLYASADDPQRFRAWLKLLLADRGCPFIEVGYPQGRAGNPLGLMTFRFLRLFTRHRAWLDNYTSLRTQDDARRFYESSSIIDEFIRVESLEADLARILRIVGASREVALDDEVNANASRHWPSERYYDDETMELVAKKDRLIVELFGYQAPSSPRE